MSTGSEVVRELTVRRPLALGVLYAHGIDAGCGRCTLATACHLHGVEPATVLDELAAAERDLARPWADRSVNELVDHVLRSYHRTFATDVEETERSLEAARPSCEPRSWADLHHLLGELRADMEQHMAKEEHVLFPWLRTRAQTAAVPVRAMQLEHADTITLLHAVHTSSARCLRDSVSPAVVVAAERLAHLERALCEHMHLENNELFPRALDASGGR